MNSSYKQNQYGRIFQNLVKRFKPKKAVELGVLDGYSTIYIVSGLKVNKDLYDICGHLDSYDLWEEYSYKHGDMLEVQRILDIENLSNYVTLYKGNAFEVHEKYGQEIDFLHVDISNDGDVIRKIMELWDDKIVHGGIIIFEGGSKERDEISWMIQYCKKPIREEIFNNQIINIYYHFDIYEAFPSITVLCKDK